MGDRLNACVDNTEAEGVPERKCRDDGFGDEHMEGPDRGCVEES